MHRLSGAPANPASVACQLAAVNIAAGPHLASAAGPDVAGPPAGVLLGRAAVAQPHSARPPQLHRPRQHQHVPALWLGEQRASEQPAAVLQAAQPTVVLRHAPRCILRMTLVRDSNWRSTLSGPLQGLSQAALSVHDKVTVVSHSLIQLQHSIVDPTIAVSMSDACHPVCCSRAHT